MADNCYAEFHWGFCQWNSSTLLHLVTRQHSARWWTIFTSSPGTDKYWWWRPWVFLELSVSPAGPSCIPTPISVYWCSLQELKGKILLKAKKIGGLEDCNDETLTDEVSDDEEMANDEAESPTAEDPPAGCLKENGKVDVLGTWWPSNFLLLP